MGCVCLLVSNTELTLIFWMGHDRTLLGTESRSRVSNDGSTVDSGLNPRWKAVCLAIPETSHNESVLLSSSVPTLAVCIRHGNNILLAAVEKHKPSRAIHDRWQRVAIELWFCQNTTADDKSFLTICDVKGWDGRMMWNLLQPHEASKNMTNQLSIQFT